MKKKKLEVAKSQYIAMGICLFLYILMLTKVFFTLPIDSKALVDLIIISTPSKVQQAIDMLPFNHMYPYYIQLGIDSLFVCMFYPLVMSLFASSPILALTVSLSGVGDIIENGISFYYLTQRAPSSLIVSLSSVATNVKFLFLILSLILIAIKLLRKES